MVAWTVQLGQMHQAKAKDNDHTKIWTLLMINGIPKIFFLAWSFDLDLTRYLLQKQTARSIYAGGDGQSDCHVRLFSSSTISCFPSTCISRAIY